MTERAIFIDRDGVINVRRANHVRSWREFQFLPGALLAMRELALMKERAVVVTNQAAVGRGLMTIAELTEIHSEMAAAVRMAGGKVDRVYVCPHRPDTRCGCRKPGIQLLLNAAAELGVTLGRSVLVGDSHSDMEAALAAGCQPIFIGEADGHGLGRELPVAVDLLGAVSLIRRLVSTHQLPC